MRLPRAIWGAFWVSCWGSWAALGGVLGVPGGVLGGLGGSRARPGSPGRGPDASKNGVYDGILIFIDFGEVQGVATSVPVMFSQVLHAPKRMFCT